MKLDKERIKDLKYRYTGFKFYSKNDNMVRLTFEEKLMEDINGLLDHYEKLCCEYEDYQENYYIETAYYDSERV